MALTVCVLGGLVAGSYPGVIIPAVARAVGEQGGRVVAMQTVATGIDYHEEVALEDLAHVGWRGIAGFIAIANAVSRDYLEAIREAGKPVVCIGNEEPGFSCPAVLADNATGTRQAVEHLLAHGHRRIAFVGYLGEFDIRERYEAYRSALVAYGVEPDPELLFPAANNLETGGVGAARALLAVGLPSTAVFAATDLNAVAVMKVLQGAGLVLPRDQAVVGFDDDPDAELVSPSLSTVTHDVAHLGRLASHLLLRQLAGGVVAPGRHVVPTAYLARESCGCTGAGAEASLALARSLLAARNDSYYEMRKMVRDDYNITVDLLYNDRDPRLLAWLQNTTARAGVLGLWRGEPAGGGGQAGPGPGGPSISPVPSRLPAARSRSARPPWTWSPSPRRSVRGGRRTGRRLPVPAQERQGRLGFPGHLPPSGGLPGAGNVLHVVGAVQRGPVPERTSALAQPKKRGTSHFLSTGKGNGVGGAGQRTALCARRPGCQ